MSTLQYIIIFFYFLLLLSRKSRQGALVMLLSFFAYGVVINNFSWEYYYASAGLLQLVLVMALSKRYLSASVCSLLLIVVNFYGFVICYNYYPPVSYDIACAAILIIQLLLIASKGLLNGINTRGGIESFLVRVHNITSFKKDHVLSKGKEEKGFNK